MCGDPGNQNVKTWSKTNYSIYGFVWGTAGSEISGHLGSISLDSEPEVSPKELTRLLSTVLHMNQITLVSW